MLTALFILLSLIGYNLIGFATHKVLTNQARTRDFKKRLKNYSLPYRANTKNKTDVEIEYMRRKELWEDTARTIYNNDTDMAITGAAILWPIGIPIFETYFIASSISSGNVFKPKVERDLAKMQAIVEMEKSKQTELKSLINTAKSMGLDVAELEKLSK